MSTTAEPAYHTVEDYRGSPFSAVGGAPCMVNRITYTGDLGYEIWMDAEHALPVWDALIAAGALEQKAFEYDSDEAKEILERFDSENELRGE